MELSEVIESQEVKDMANFDPDTLEIKDLDQFNPSTFDLNAQRAKMYASLGVEAPDPIAVAKNEASEPAAKAPEKPQEATEEEDNLDLDAYEDVETEQANASDSDSDEPFSEEDLELMRKDDKHAVKTAKEEGRKRKLLEREKQFLEEQNVKLSQQYEETKSELEKYSHTRVDPKSHPDFQKALTRAHSKIISALDDEIGSEVAEVFESTGWGQELTEAHKMVGGSVAERRQIKEPLRLAIAKKLGMVDRNATELDSYTDSDAISTADKVISVLNRNISSYEELADIHQTIENKSVTKSLEIGYKEYTQKTQAARKNMMVVATMTEKDMSDDPDSLQSFVAKKIHSSVEAKSQFDKVSKVFLEMGYGPEVLSQEELDRHVNSGKDMEEFHRNREKRVIEFREKKLPELALLYYLLPEIKKALPEYFKKTGQAKFRQDSQRVLSNTIVKTGSLSDSNASEPPTKEQILARQTRALLGY